MKQFILLLMISNSISKSLSKKICGEEPVDKRFNNDAKRRVFNGNEAHPAEFPWHVGIALPSRVIICGGSIISMRNVLTSLTCIDLKMELFIIAGTITRDDPDPIIYNITNRYVRIENDIRYNIALLKTGVNMEYNYYLYPIQMVTHEIKDHGYGPMDVVGWGFKGEIGQTLVSNELRVSMNNFVDWVEDETICVFSEGGWPCYGDGGGGLVKYYPKDFAELVGIFTAGPESCEDGRDREYANVYFHREWILDFADMDEVDDPYECRDPKPKDTNTRKDGFTPKRRIFEGRKALEGETPWAAVIANVDFFIYCMGTIVSKKAVVTAGHCVKRACYIYTDTYDIEHINQVRYILESYKLTEDSITEDIGTIIVTPNFEFDEYVRPVALPDVALKAGDGPMAVAGFGVYDVKGKGSDYMRVSYNITVLRVSPKHPGVVCEFSQDGHQELSGDSGAGLIYHGKLVCIHSAGYPPYIEYSEGLCVHVWYYKYWIQEHMY